MTDITVDGVTVTVTDPVFVRNVVTAVEVFFSYAHTYGASISAAPDTHNISVYASDVDLSTNISSPSFDTLATVLTHYTITQQDVNNKTLELELVFVIVVLVFTDVNNVANCVVSLS